MIVYNVTVKVDSDIAEEWLEWMRQVHIPDVMKTACFTNFDILALRFPKDDIGRTYAIQYTCRSMSDLDLYHRNFASALQADHVTRFGDRAVAFRTILEHMDKL